MAEWLSWLVLAVVLGVAEIFSLTAVLGILGGAAVVTAGVAGLGLPLPVQILFFAVASIAGVPLLRPIAQRHLLRPSSQRFGVEALVGESAYVVQEVTGRDGRVRLGGEEWSARALDETSVIPTGTVVDVMEISGSTAIVYPRE